MMTVCDNASVEGQPLPVERAGLRLDHAPGVGLDAGALHVEVPQIDHAVSLGQHRDEVGMEEAHGIRSGWRRLGRGWR